MTADNPPDLESRLAAGFDRWVDGAPDTPRPITAVIRRSRTRAARQRAATAIVTVAAVFALGVVVTRPAPNGGGTGSLAGPDRDTAETIDGEPGTASPDLQLVSSLQSFDSCDELLGWVKAAARTRVGPYGFGSDVVPARNWSAGGDLRFEDGRGFDGGARAGAGGATDQSATNMLVPEGPARYAADAAPGVAGAADVSGTNTEEVGVDEPDIVKADPDRIVSVLDRTVATFRLVDGTPRAAGHVTLPDWTRSAAPNGSSSGSTHGYVSIAPTLLVHADRALVIEQIEVNWPAQSGGSVVTDFDGNRVIPYYQPRPRTVATQVDLTDLDHPRLLDTVHIDGRYVDTRMVDGVARVVVSSESPAWLPFVNPSIPGDKPSEDAATAANQAIVDASTIEDWVPGYRRGSALTTEVQVEPATPFLDCARIRHPKTFSGLGMLSVLSVSVGGTLDPADAIGVVAAADRVYASPTTLYASTVAAAPEPATPPTDTTQGTAGSTPATYPPNQPLPDPRTAIHAFAITGTGPATYRGSGEVDGLLLQSFSMSERDGVLRTATTLPPVWQGGRAVRENVVSTLRIADGELQPLGSVTGIGKDEDIKAVRFVDDVGYVVTFRQTDPLFTVDLRDPAAPRIAGELTMLGYSAYLHPVGPGRLLGIGQDASETGRTTGTQVVLYDVSDPAAPTVLSKATVPLSNTLVEADYHAFLWWAKTGQAVVPVRAALGPDAFVGAIALHVTDTEVTETARITNPITFVWCPPGGAGCVVPTGPDCDVDGVCLVPDNPIGDPILRSIVVGDRLLTLSNDGIQSLTLDGAAPRTFTPLPEGA